MSGKLETTVMQSQVSGASKRESGLGEEEEEKVGVGSERNNLTELWLTPHPHQTYAHTLEHITFCHEHVCPTHYPYGGNQ
jgi:hypothetical protein